MSNHGHSALARVMEVWPKMEGMFDFQVVNLGGMGILAQCVGRRLVIECHYEVPSSGSSVGPMFKVHDVERDEYVGEPTPNPTRVVDFVLHELLQGLIDERRRIHPAVRY